MAHVFTLANGKGGCSNSSVALNLAVCFARSGQRILAIDLDQQGISQQLWELISMNSSSPLIGF